MATDDGAICDKQRPCVGGSSMARGTKPGKWGSKYISHKNQPSGLVSEIPETNKRKYNCAKHGDADADADDTDDVDADDADDADVADADADADDCVRWFLRRGIGNSRQMWTATWQAPTTARTTIVIFDIFIPDFLKVLNENSLTTIVCLALQSALLPIERPGQYR